MHEAGTNHSKYALPVYTQKDQDSNDFLPPLSRTTVRNLLDEYDDALASGSPLAIAIDEVSMLDAITFGRILKRVEEFESDYFDSTPPRLFILVGKFLFYVRSVVSCTLDSFSSIYRRLFPNTALQVYSVIQYCAGQCIVQKTISTCWT
jgi:hypothetical protein